MEGAGEASRLLRVIASAPVDEYILGNVPEQSVPACSQGSKDDELKNVMNTWKMKNPIVDDKNILKDLVKHINSEGSCEVMDLKSFIKKEEPFLNNDDDLKIELNRFSKYLNNEDYKSWKNENPSCSKTTVKEEDNVFVDSKSISSSVIVSNCTEPVTDPLETTTKSEINLANTSHAEDNNFIDLESISNSVIKSNFKHPKTDPLRLIEKDQQDSAGIIIKDEDETFIDLESISNSVIKSNFREPKTDPLRLTNEDESNLDETIQENCILPDLLSIENETDKSEPKTDSLEQTKRSEQIKDITIESILGLKKNYSLDRSEVIELDDSSSDDDREECITPSEQRLSEEYRLNSPSVALCSPHIDNPAAEKKTLDSNKQTKDPQTVETDDDSSLEAEENETLPINKAAKEPEIVEIDDDSNPEAEEGSSEQTKNVQKVMPTSGTPVICYTYANLISLAILSSPNKHTGVSGILKYIGDNFPGFCKRKENWESLIMNYLFHSKYFVKLVYLKRTPDEHWTFKPSCEKKMIARLGEKNQNIKKNPPTHVLDQKINQDNDFTMHILKNMSVSRPKSNETPCDDTCRPDKFSDVSKTSIIKSWNKFFKPSKWISSPDKKITIIEKNEITTETAYCSMFDLQQNKKGSNQKRSSRISKNQALNLMRNKTSITKSSIGYSRTETLTKSLTQDQRKNSNKLLTLTTESHGNTDVEEISNNNRDRETHSPIIGNNQSHDNISNGDTDEINTDTYPKNNEQINFKYINAHIPGKDDSFLVGTWLNVCPKKLFPNEIPAEKKFVCQKCNKAFDSKRKLTLHSGTHDGLKKYVCHSCCVAFRTKSALKIHNEGVHSNTTHQCPKCSKVLKSRTSLRSHIFQQHTKNSNTEGAFTCDLCQKTYKSKKQLQRHYSKKHNSENEFICNDCSSSFTNKEFLLLHIQANHMTNTFKCSSCSDVFSTYGKLYHHLRIAHLVNKREMFICETCGKVYKTKISLNQHFLSHTSQKPFVCEECGKCFRTESNLQQHSRTHSDIRPFTCDLCHKSFRIRNHLKQHMAVHGLKSTANYRKRKRRISTSSSSNSNTGFSDDS